MRILLGAVVVWDCIARLWSCSPLFWGGPLSPSQASFEGLQLPIIPSIHIFNGSYGYQACLEIFRLMAAACLLLGWNTKTATWCTWLLTLSLHFSNELVLNGGDYLLRLYLFTGLFLPWGHSFSLDSKNETSQGEVVATAGTVFLFAQVCLLYWSAAMLKVGDAWTQEYSALYKALNLGNFVTPLGESLLSQPECLEWITRLVLGVEWVAPVLLICGVARIRFLGILSLVLLHLGIALTLAVGLFWVVPLTALMAFIPGQMWEQQSSSASEISATSKPVTALLVLLACLLAYLNVAYDDALELPTPQLAYAIPRTLGLHYGWGMFTGLEKQDDTWLEARATLADGTDVDILWNREPTSDRPSGLCFRYPNQRWRRYVLNLRDERQAGYRRAFLAFLKKRYEQRNGTKIVGLEMALYTRVIHPKFRDTEPMRESLLRW